MTEGRRQVSRSGPGAGGVQAVAEREAAGSDSGAFTEEGHRARLMQNYNYDLMEELTNLLQGAWRIDAYLKDSGGKCDSCGQLWQDVRKQQEYLIEKIRQEIVSHAKDGRFV